MDIIYWYIRSSSGRGSDGVKVVDGGDRYFASYKFYFVTVHDNLV